MKKLKKLMWLLFLQASPALAEIEKPTAPTGIGETSLKDLITTISSTLLLILGAVAVLFIIIGGFQYISSAGNPENVGKAKTTILYGVIGIIAALLSYAIVQFVITNIK